MFTRRVWLSLAAAASATANQISRWRPVLTVDDTGDFVRLVGAGSMGHRILLAAGEITSRLDRSRENLLFHSEDQGVRWVQRRAPDRPLALFALSESHVWLLGERKLAFSNDGGWSWRPLSRPRNASGIHFLSDVRGLAFAGDRVHQTTDGGANWSLIPESRGEPTPRNLRWTLAHFRDPGHGWIAGAADLPVTADTRGPEGVELSRSQRQRLRLPGLAMLHTSDGGVSWQSTVQPAPGDLADLIEEDGSLTGAFLGDAFTRFPGTVAARQAGQAAWQVLLREERLSVQSLFRNPSGLLAAGTLEGRVHVRARQGSAEWQPLPVHYSAQSPEARFFPGPDDAPWLWLSSGMILAPVR